MKHILSIVVILLLAQACDAQKIRFTDTSNVWYYTFTRAHSNGQFLGEYQGDSLFNGVTYLVMRTPPFALGIRLVREDSINKKIYVIDDTSEKLLYDFTLEVGDTFSYISPTGVINYHIVNKVDSVQIDSIWYKVRHFKNISGGFPYTVIDNIGCTGGITFPFWTYTTTVYFQRLNCFFNNRSKPIMSNAISTPYGLPFTNTDSCYVSVGDVVGEKDDKVSISPHPVTSVSTMSLPYLMKEATYTLYNAMGQKVEQRTIRNLDKLQLQQHNTGVYYYIVSDEVKGKAYRGKIIFE
ncbi:MAG: T9SS type A sorting domain-containing protein [Chitinophagales bacterium]|nr:T9SS type A sorting domain-containing protein [Chitinophagaceae bacterium]MCB9063649.1 T9SS type A sorting domain-containing protein [Chitinophagales bacterium]